MLGTITGISGRIVENVFLFVAAISVILLAIITFLMIYFVIRYRRKRNPKPTEIYGSTWLEIVWTLVPTILVLAMFFYGLTGFKTLKTIPAGAMKVKVDARMWSWLFEYENGAKADSLRVPLGKPVELLLTSSDVIHSFYVPAFKIKQDAVPGMVTRMWFKATEVGAFDVLCAEYCGLRHSYMLTKVEVLPDEAFNQWYEKAKVETKLTPPGPRLFREKGCFACHSVDGTPMLGPTLKSLFGKTVVVLVNGQERNILADEGYLRKSILEPNAELVKGFPPVMPPQKLTEGEMSEILNYLKGLK